jgi:predicted branched-subunit amino acid permease
VIFIAVFWFALKHEKTLLPFVASTALIIGVYTAFRFFPMFLISLPSMIVGLAIHLFLAAPLSYPIRRIILRR